MPRQRLLEVVTLILILAAAAGLRLAQLDRLPPGMYWDEAFDGSDALRVLAGERPLYFPDNNGREPMFMYLVAGSLYLFGRSPVAIRLVSAVAGTLGVLGIFLAMRAMFGRRVGVLAAALSATTLWPVQLSRLAIRPPLLLPFLGFALWQGTLGWKTGRRRHWAMSGIIFGLAFYTYLPVRLVPLVLAAFAICLFLRKPRRLPAGAVSGGAIFLLIAAVVVAPLGLYAATHWEVVMLRASQLSIASPEVNHGDFWGTLLEQTRATALMFFFRGDENPRHNVPFRPVFDPLTSVAFVIGLVVALRRRRGEWAVVLCALWSLVLLLPAVFAPENPHFLRASGALPVIFVWPALGLDEMGRIVARRLRPWLGTVLMAGVILLGAGLTVRDYFLGPYASSRELYYAFDGHATDLALEINRFLDVGWRGRDLLARDDAPRPGRLVIVEDRLWDFHRAIPFLVPIAPSPAGPVVLADVHQSRPWPPLDLGSAEVKLMFVPGAEAGLRDYLPRGALLSAEDGLYIPTPDGLGTYLLYRTFTATRPAMAGGPIGCLGAGIALSTAHVRPEARALRVELIWHTPGIVGRDYTAFVHVLDDDGNTVGQHDSPLADGLLPSGWWRPDDFIRDVHTVPLSLDDQPRARLVAVGMYRPDTGERLPASDCHGTLLGDQIVVSLTEASR